MHNRIFKWITVSQPVSLVFIKNKYMGGYFGIIVAAEKIGQPKTPLFIAFVDLKRALIVLQWHTFCEVLDYKDIRVRSVETIAKMVAI